MTALLIDSPLARENEAAHAVWRELVEDLSAYLEKEETKNLTQRIVEPEREKPDEEQLP
jgi:hypothetical protein